MIRQYRREALATGHETGLVRTETALLSKRTMRRFDGICPSSMQDMTPHDIRALRLRLQASQAVFVRHLNMATDLVRK